jgi:hypothetical protein
VKRVAALLLLLLFGASGVSAEPVVLAPGTTEVGLAASLTSASETTTGSASVRVSRFVGVGGALFVPGIDFGYAHVREHDALEALAVLGWTGRVGDGAAYPFVAFVGGVRQDWQGSFREARFPVGGAVGLRTVVGERAGVVVEYRVLRVVDDPVAAFTEQQVRVGVLLFL